MGADLPDDPCLGAQLAAAVDDYRATWQPGDTWQQSFVSK